MFLVEGDVESVHFLYRTSPFAIHVCETTTNITAAYNLYYIPETHHGQRESVKHFLSEVTSAQVN